MKDENYSGIICKRFCSFYKEGKKEDLCCGAFSFLNKNLTPRELRLLLDLLKSDERSRERTLSADKEIKRLVCDRCDFLVDGCDYREDGSQPPCGGYTIIAMLLKS